MICKAGNLSRDDIGAIRVQETESFVEVLKTSVPGFLKAIGPNLEIEEGAFLTQLDRAPNIKFSPKEKFDRSDKQGKPFKSKKPWDKDDKPRGDKPRAKKHVDDGAHGEKTGFKPKKADDKKGSKQKNRSKGKPAWAKDGKQATSAPSGPQDKTKAGRGKNAVLKRRK